MKIGLVAPPWLPVPPPSYGGSEVVVDRLARGLRARGHEIVLYATGDSTCPVPTSSTYDHEQMHHLGSGLVELRHVVDAYEALAGSDLIHDHTVLGPLYAAHTPTPPVVTTVHGALDDELRSLYSAVDDHVAVVAISRNQARSAPDVHFAAVIHHGIDVDQVPYGSGDGGYLMFLGRMAPEKGPHRAIDVARRVGLPIVVAGKCRSRDEREFFETEVRPRLGTDVDWVGEVGGIEKYGLLGGAVALVNPIRWREPFGLVMIEAMAAGTPVVATAEGAAPEIVEGGVSGFLCRSEGEMAAAVSAAIELDREACRESVARRFSTDRMVDDHLGLYGRLVPAGLVEPSLRVMASG